MKIVFYVFFFLLSYSVLAQKHDNIWITGYNGQNPWPTLGGTFYDFESQPPEIYKQVIDADFSRTNSVISDKEGNLLFYTNGGHVFDWTHEIMQNGEIIGDSAFIEISGIEHRFPQASLILPHPTKDSLFALFNLKMSYDDNFNIRATGLFYSEIDMTLNNFKGEVVLKKHLLVDDTLNYSKLTATKHANGKDWWVLCYEQQRDKFYTILLSNEGAQIVSIQNFGANADESGGMAVFTPDGTRYIKHDLRLLPDGNTVDIYDFDRCTGELSNNIHIEMGDTTGITGGVAVSPNSRFLYITVQDSIYQYDFWADDFLGSRTVVLEYDGYEDFFTAKFNGPQLAPDGKIYISTSATLQYLHKINLPNLKGDSCQAVQRAIILPTNHGRMLPNMPNYRLGPLDGSLCDTLGLNNYPLANFTWETDSLTVFFSDNSSYAPTDWLWDFDGLGSSTTPDPTFTFPSEGVYPVCQMVSNQYDADTTCHNITVSYLAANFSFEADELNVNFQDLSISEPFDWYWEFGDGETSNEQNPNHAYAISGEYEVCLTIMDEWAEVTFCDSVSLDIIDHVVNSSKEDLFRIYPNPANDFISIAISENLAKSSKEIQIIDATGKVTQSIKNNSSESILQISTQNIQSGIYWIVIKNDETFYQAKIVILR